MNELISLNKECKILRLGIVNYREAYGLQKSLLQKKIEGSNLDYLILLQHNPVITIGRNGNNKNILVSESLLKSYGIELFEIERGGDVTYHGPGQITGYPILDLHHYKKDVHWYIRNLEEVIIRALNEYGVTGKRMDKYTGVWVDDEKIAAIGVAIKHWITFHGFAFNVCPDLSHFKLINPCGITDKSITSLEKVLGYKVNFEDVEQSIISNFLDLFDIDIKQDQIISQADLVKK